MDIFAVCALALLTSVICIFIKQYKPEFGAITVIASTVMILSFAAKYAGALISTYFGLAESVGVDSDIFEVLIKSLGITYLTVFTAELCRDFGQNSLAVKVETAGKISVIILATPMIVNIIKIAGSLI